MVLHTIFTGPVHSLLTSLSQTLPLSTPAPVTSSSHLPFVRFARSKKPSHQHLLSDFREACQNIWKKQASALSLQWKDIRPPRTKAEGDEGEENTEDEDEEDDDFDDEFSDLEDDVAAKGSTAHGKVPSSGGGGGRKKEEEDTKELKSIQTGEFFDSLTTNPPASASASTSAAPGTSTSGTSTGGNPSQLQPSEFLVSQKGPQWEPPKQVVKRIIRKIKPDGSETIEVRFIVSDVEVSRVQAKNGGNQSTKRKNVTQAPTHEFEDLFEDEKSEAHALKLNIGKMKNKVSTSFSSTLLMKISLSLPTTLHPLATVSSRWW
jgi:hypothetical protein